MEPTELFYKKHITFTAVNEIREICMPFLDSFGLSYFTFDRTYEDGSHLRLTTAGEWIEHYYRQKLYRIAIFEKDPKYFSTGFLFWSWLNREPVYSEASYFNIDHGITIIKSEKNFSDFFHFGTFSKNLISEQFYIQNMNQFNRFINIFKYQAKNLIQSAENERFILPGIQKNYSTSISNLSLPKNNLIISRFGYQRNFGYYLGNQFNHQYLTKREVDILILLKSGIKICDISKVLYISKRTIETYLERIKAKLNCKTLFELGYAISQFNLEIFNDINIQKIGI